MVMCGWTFHPTPQQPVGGPAASPRLSAHNLSVLCPSRLVYPKLFSQCSEQDMWQFLGDPRTSCLLNAPRADELYGGPVCGNQFVERGEQCDCGTPEVGGLPKGLGRRVGSRGLRSAQKTLPLCT